MAILSIGGWPEDEEEKSLNILFEATKRTNSFLTKVSWNEKASIINSNKVHQRGFFDLLWLVERHTIKFHETNPDILSIVFL